MGGGGGAAPRVQNRYRQKGAPGSQNRYQQKGAPGRQKRYQQKGAVDGPGTGKDYKYF